MKKLSLYSVFLIVILSVVSCRSEIKNFVTVDRLPEVFPDYTGITIPPNIAPLNFKILEQGIEFEVKISSEKEKPITIRSKSPVIKIDINSWHNFLEKSQGSSMNIDVYAKSKSGKWEKYQTIVNEVSTKKIDNHLAYRLINTGYVFWSQLGIYQRNLENFDEKPILENKSFEYGCLNCHSFCANDPDKMMIHIRAIHGGTVINRDGKLTKINTKTKYTLNAGVYPAWHPDGKHIAFSVNNINQHFCNGEVRIEVSDEASDIVVYDIENNTVTTSSGISTASRENLPTWSPDGKFLYFISAPEVSELGDRIHPQYELLRIEFDAGTNRFGKIDTIISAKQTGKSISFPKISPDGKFLMFTLSDYGYFTIHHPMADLYLLNLENREFHKMEVNSPQTDSYHCFSSTGGWFVFSSKRIDGLFTRPFFSQLDEKGNASKPFVLPQEDPEFYDTFIKNYNVPELIKGEVKVSPLKIRDEVLKDAVPAKIDPSVDTLYMNSHLAKKVK